MFDVSLQFIVLIPIVLGVVQAAKSAGLPSRYAALVSIALGVLGAYTLGGFSNLNLVQGIIAGLSAAGLWSGTKATFGMR